MSNHQSKQTDPAFYTRVFELFLQERRFKTVAEIINAEGFRTRNQALFTGQAVSRILRDASLLEKGLVTRELWQSCGAVLSAQSKSGAPSRRARHLCSGLLRCGCGAAMYVPSGSQKYTCADCRNKIAKDDLEAIVVANLQEASASEIRGAALIWNSLSPVQKRELVESCISEITLDGKKVTLSLFASG